MSPVPEWRKSSRSNQDSACVEVAHTLDALRDSKNPTGPTLTGPAIPTLLRTLTTGHRP